MNKWYVKAVFEVEATTGREAKAQVLELISAGDEAQGTRLGDEVEVMVGKLEAN